MKTITPLNKHMQADPAMTAGLLMMCLLMDGCAHNISNTKQEYSQLVESLHQTPLKGINIGPAIGVMPNSTTELVVKEGKPIVPYLVSALSDNNLTEVVYAVFCLRELGAPKEALPVVLRLKRDLEAKKRFDFPRDLTLELQIQYFIRDSHEKGSAHPTGAVLNCGSPNRRPKTLQ